MDKLEFRVEWLDYNRAVYSTIIVRTHDLTDAIAEAARIMQRGRLGSADAHGFFVQVKR